MMLVGIGIAQDLIVEVPVLQCCVRFGLDSLLYVPTQTLSTRPIKRSRAGETSLARLGTAG
jgi:hypothetical protein